jgi:peptidyl-prolyl cis-trans isomerase C
MRQNFSRCVVWALVGLLFVLGCSKKENQVVAKVGNRSITVADLNARIQNVTYSSWEDEYKKRNDILNGIINDQLMIAAAQEQGLDQDPAFHQKMRSAERNALLEQLYRKEVLDKSKPSEKEIKAAYDKMGWELRARHILVGTEEEAKKLREEIMNGADFAQLAKEHSNDPSTKDKGGDLGYFGWGKMVPAFQDTVYAMEIGEVSLPVQSRFGWHIIKLEDRRTVDRPDWAEEKDRIERKLTSDRSKVVAEEYVTTLKEKSNIQIDPEAAQVLLNNLMARKTAPGDFTPEQLEMTVVTFKGGSWNIARFLEELQSIPPMYQPRVKDMDDLDALVKNILTGQLLEDKARQMGLQNDKEVIEKLRKEKENALLQIFRQKGIPRDTTVTDEEIQAYYQDNSDRFTSFEKVHVLEIQLDSAEDAQKVLQQLRAGADFAKLAEEKSTRAWAAKKGGDLDWLDKRRYPNISGAALKLKVGELGGPIQDGNKFSVIKVIGKKPAELKPLDEVRQSIVGTLRRDKEVEATTAWLEKERQKVGVEIYENVLLSTMTSPKEESAS